MRSVSPDSPASLRMMSRAVLMADDSAACGDAGTVCFLVLGISSPCVQRHGLRPEGPQYLHGLGHGLGPGVELGCEPRVDPVPVGRRVGERFGNGMGGAFPEEPLARVEQFGRGP